MSNIKEIKQEIRVNESAVMHLENILDMAKKGEISSVSISWVTKEGSISGVFSSSDNGLLLWASMSHNERQFYQDVLNED